MIYVKKDNAVKRIEDNEKDKYLNLGYLVYNKKTGKYEGKQPADDKTSAENDKLKAEIDKLKAEIEAFKKKD